MQELGYMDHGRPSLVGAGSASDVLLVTDRRILWVIQSPRWVTSLPFSMISSWTEASQAHRYALILGHAEITRLQWVPKHRFLWWSWGNDEAVRSRTRSILAFSHKNTKAVQAIRTRLEAMAVSRGNPVTLPVQRDRRGPPLWSDF